MKFLMTYPRFFDVSYKINSWMSVSKKPDTQIAIKQWRNLYNLLSIMGANIDVINPVEGLPDLVFTANAGTVLNKTFIPSNFKYKERQDEVKFFTKWFKDNGYHILGLPDGICHEGHGDMLKLYNKYIQGYGFRSDYESIEIMSCLLNEEVVPVKLVNSYFYHLDTCFCPFKLNDKCFFLYCDKAFSEDSLNIIENLPYDKFCVSLDEAKLFACNSIQVGNNAIIQVGCDKTTEWLNSMGLLVTNCDMNSFHLSGGSAACCQLRID